MSWTHAYAPLGTPLADRNRASLALSECLRALPAVPGSPKLALFPMVNEQGAFAGCLRKVILDNAMESRVFGSHRRAMLSLDAKAEPVAGKKMKELRRQFRRLQELGEISRDTINQPEKIGSAIDEYLALESDGWKGRGGSAAGSDPAAAAFMRESVSSLARAGQAQIDFLRVGQRAAAAAITLSMQDRAWFWKISYNEEFARFSPGVQLTFLLTGEWQRTGRFAHIDSCAIENHPMIDHLWHSRLDIADRLVGLSSPASFAAGAVMETARRLSIAGIKAARYLVR